MRPAPVLAFKVTDCPWQNVVGPAAVIVAHGKGLTVTTALEVALQVVALAVTTTL